MIYSFKDIIRIRNIHHVSWRTLQSYMKRAHRTPRLRSTIYDHTECFSMWDLGLQHLGLALGNGVAAALSLSQVCGLIINRQY